MTASTTQHLLELTQQLLDSISNGDWSAYEQLCAPSITCFEPEARGHLVEGLAFHRFYFDLGGHMGRHNNTIASPHVRLIGDDAAIVSYVRLVQFVDASGTPHTNRFEETRVWEKQNGHWRHVHFHRS